MGLTQLRWQYSKVLLKAAAEMAGVVKAALLCNLYQGMGAVQNQRVRLLQAPF